MSWLMREKREFEEFDLSAMNWAGWLLFLFAVVVMLVIGLQPYESEHRGEPVYDGQIYIRWAFGLLVAVAVFLFGRYLSNAVGIRMYRAATVKPPGLGDDASARSIGAPWRKRAE